MITAMAEVRSYHNGRLRLSSTQQTSCGSCGSQSDCGTGIVSKALPGKTLDIEIPSEKPLAIGTLVEIGLQEHAMLKSALVVYVLPLFFLILGALFGQFFADLAEGGEGTVIVISAIFALIGAVLARKISKSLERQPGYQPTILRVLGKPVDGELVTNATSEDSE
ncbi:SoxR reducing system RseC family protein [Veronia pacifica]|uniref:Transcriptional regulator n=1 Tax=Veronia pacifica TaxID=1080227 RepID=A0A1C3EJ13_9GAMM|nr:SoxR reducing system RseC family protein [Veronia pacifica]ODA33214.1 transcriptional regulator [Veronia pacifica]